MTTRTGAALTATDMLDLVRTAIVTVLEVDPGSVQLQTRLGDELGADSLALVEIAELVEAEVRVRVGAGFTLDDEVLDDLETTGDVVDHALARL